MFNVQLSPRIEFLLVRFFHRHSSKGQRHKIFPNVGPVCGFGSLGNRMKKKQKPTTKREPRFFGNSGILCSIEAISGTPPPFKGFPEPHSFSEFYTSNRAMAVDLLMSSNSGGSSLLTHRQFRTFESVPVWSKNPFWERLPLFWCWFLKCWVVADAFCFSVAPEKFPNPTNV